MNHQASRDTGAAPESGAGVGAVSNRVRKLGKGILALNLAALIRLVRFGWADFRKSLTEISMRSDPFEVRDDISRLVATYCQGRGVEVGPGEHPYCDPARTIFVDKYDKTPKHLSVQKIENAWALPFPSSAFDFLLSSHCLEHCPDTIRTLMEWKRVLRPGGRLVLILPHGLRTFDKGRALTTLAHHIDDYNRRVTLDDDTHWDEFERIAIPGGHHHWLHLPEAHLPNGRVDPRWLRDHGGMHYHVWTAKDMAELLRYVGCDVVFEKDKLCERWDSFAVVGEVPRSDLARVPAAPGANASARAPGAAT